MRWGDVSEKLQVNQKDKHIHEVKLGKYLFRGMRKRSQIPSYRKNVISEKFKNKTRWRVGVLWKRESGKEAKDLVEQQKGVSSSRKEAGEKN